ncbi:hypothetical protein KKC61_04465 [Patescibacteria group bacterium]|nr:hypothetical protein [Patescibacteria group bacterium]
MDLLEQDSLYAPCIQADIFVAGEVRQRNIADLSLDTARQPRRGEIIIGRDTNEQTTRAWPFRASRHEAPSVVFDYNQAKRVIDPAFEARSFAGTAMHETHNAGALAGRPRQRSCPGTHAPSSPWRQQNLNSTGV